METEDPLWIQVEMSISWWCASSEGILAGKPNPDFKCTCPSGKLLKASSPEGLKRLLSALENKTYAGHWKHLLNDSST